MKTLLSHRIKQLHRFFLFGIMSVPSCNAPPFFLPPTKSTVARLAQIPHQCLLGLSIEPFLHNLTNPALVSLVCSLEVPPDPVLDISDLGKGITWRLFASVKLREANTKAQLVNVCIRNDVIGSCWNGGVDQKFDQSLSCELPAFRVSVNESL